MSSPYDNQVAQRISRTIASVPTNAYRFVKPTANVNEVDVVSAANSDASGVLLALPRSIGDAVEIAVDGIVPVEAGAAVADGDHVISDASGRAITDPATATTTSVVMGKAMNKADAAGDIIGVKLGVYKIKR